MDIFNPFDGSEPKEYKAKFYAHTIYEYLAKNTHYYNSLITPRYKFGSRVQVTYYPKLFKYLR